jgi:hypothetical protein
VYAKGTKRLQVIALLMLAVTCQSASVQAASSEDPIAQIDFRRHFYCYNCNVDWDALSDPNNSSILNACLAHADIDKLQQLGLRDLHERLESLQQGNLIKKDDRKYCLAFPAIVGTKRVWFEKEIERIAAQMWPATQQMVQELSPHLKGCEHMKYHVVWSLVMDGQVAWWSLQQSLKNQLGSSVSLAGIHWLIYPQHAYSAGTNTYFDNGRGLAAAITWTHTTPSPSTITARLGPYADQFAQAVLHNRPVEDSQAIRALAPYGLVDDDGSVRIYILDSDSAVSQEIALSGVTFAVGAIKHMQVQKLADMLAVSAEQALVIAYHELCYEMLKRLAASGTVEIPEIARRANAPTKQMHRLISFAIIRDPGALQQQLRSKLQDLMKTQD